MSGWTNTEVTGWADSWDRDTAAVPAILLRGPRGPTLTKYRSPVQKPHSSHQTCSRVQGGELTPPRVLAIHTSYLLCFAQWNLGTATEYPHERAVRRPGLDGGASPGWGALWGQRGQGILAPPQSPPHLTPLRRLAAAGPAGSPRLSGL